MTPAEHNAAQWLVVRWTGGRIIGNQAVPYGWYVVRVCSCHWGEPVTRPYASEANAEHARTVLLAVPAAMGEPQPSGQRTGRPAIRPHRWAPARVGQIWRRNRLDRAHCHYFIVVAVAADRMTVRSIYQAGGLWRPMPGTRRSTIHFANMPRTAHGAAYSLVEDVSLGAA